VANVLLSLSIFSLIVYLERGRLFFKTSVRPVMLYGAECWTFSRTDEILWMCSKGRIIGGVGSTGNYNLFKEPRLSVVICIARLGWAGHVARMEGICMPRRLMYMHPEGLRKVGRPRSRWRGEVGS
jgi:hypothetical protein